MAVAGRVGIVSRGTYTAGDSYMRLDYVKYGNSTYLCKKDCIDVLPTDAEYWMLVTTNAITDTSDLIVKFEEERVRENIHTDETHAKLFGKIRKWFADLKNVAFSGSYSDLTDTPDIDGMNEKIQECFQSASDGKAKVASAITGMGVETASDATYATMAENITNIKTHEGTASVDDVLDGKTFSNDEDMGLTGTMPNHSGESLEVTTVTQDSNYVYVPIPEKGYYNSDSQLKILNDYIAKNTKPYILTISASCDQPYGTYNWEGSGSVVDAVSGSTIFSTDTRGTYYFTYNGRSYRATLDGDTVYGEYNPYVNFSVYDNTKGVSVATSTGSSIRVYWNGTGYQGI